MLKIIILMFLITTTTFCHKQRTHQYLVREAYSLLKIFLGNRAIPVLDGKIGTTQTGNWASMQNHGAPWVGGKVVVGAFREDEEDPVFKYGSDATPILPGRIFWSSVTHFWEADNGPDDLINLDWGGTNIPNAYTKINKYAYGGWDLLQNVFVHNFPTNPDGTGSCSSQMATLNFCYNSLVDLYKGNLYVKSVTWLNGITTVFNQPIRMEPRHWSTVNGVSTLNEFICAVTFEILGRMCHLLGDMSVPVHVHSQSHANGDTYEDFIGTDNANEWASNPFTNYWDANRVWSNYHSIVMLQMEKEK